MNPLKKPILVLCGEDDTRNYNSIVSALYYNVDCDSSAYIRLSSFVYRVAEGAERWCAEHGLRVKDRPGMIVIDTSAMEELPKEYNHKCLVMEVSLVRKTRGWYLVGLRKYELSPNESGGRVYWVTPAQDARVKAWLSAQYAAVAPKAPKAPKSQRVE